MIDDVHIARWPIVTKFGNGCANREGSRICVPSKKSAFDDDGGSAMDSANCSVRVFVRHLLCHVTNTTLILFCKKKKFISSLYKTTKKGVERIATNIMKDCSDTLTGKWTSKTLKWNVLFDLNKSFPFWNVCLSRSTRKWRKTRAKRMTFGSRVTSSTTGNIEFS